MSPAREAYYAAQWRAARAFRGHITARDQKHADAWWRAYRKWLAEERRLRDAQ